jgi:hypothetical protein
VVEVRVPISRIQDRFQAALPAHEAMGFANNAAEVSVTYPVPAEWVVDCRVVPRRVEFTAAAGLLGLTTNELSRRVDADEIVPGP